MLARINPHSFHSSYLLPHDSAGRIARELWWTSQVSPAGIIISPWFSMLMYHLGNEKYARWWPRFREVIGMTDGSINHSILK
jgi:hypothetical protein